MRISDCTDYSFTDYFYNLAFYTVLPAYVATRQPVQGYLCKSGYGIII